MQHAADEAPEVPAGVAPQEEPGEAFRFGDFLLRTHPERLLRGRQTVPLQPQPAKALSLLLERAGSVVTREELREHLWGNSFLEYDQGINFAIRKIRQAIGDDPAKPQFIETLPKLGYRFIAPVVREPRQTSRWTGSTRRSTAARLVAWFALPALLGALAVGSLRKPSMATAPTVAVLPFHVSNLPPASTAELMGWSLLEQETAADGLSAVLTEEWLAELGATFGADASLIAMDPAARLDESDASLVEAAAALGADLTVRGRLTSSDGTVYLALRALRVSDRVSVWTHRSAVTGASRTGALQLAARDARQALRIGGSPRRQAPRPPVSEATYALYLKGRYLTMSGAQSNEDSTVAEGMSLLRQVLVRDPDFGRAHSALAHAHLMRIGLSAAPEDLAAARHHGERALAADSSLAEAHLVLGALAMYSERDWSAARSNFERALSLEPGLSRSYRLYGAFLSAVGEHEAALDALGRAVELDPTSSRALGGLAEGHLFARNYSRALEAADKAAEAGPFNSAAPILGAHLLLLQNKEEAALARMNERFKARFADVDRWHLELVEHLADIPAESNASHATRATYHALLGDSESALGALEQALASAADAQLPFVAVDPRLDSLRGEPRFRRIVAELRLPSR